MSSLPSPNHQTSTQRRLTLLLDDLEASASSEERITLMAEFISIVSCNLSTSSNPRTRECLMLEDAIQMFGRCIAHQRRVMIMQSRMVMWLEDPLSGRAELAWGRLAINGLKLSLQRLERSFLRLLRDWIQNHFAAVSSAFPSTQTGNTVWTEPLTVHPGAYLLSQKEFMDSMSGYEEIWELISQVRNIRCAGLSYLLVGFCGQMIVRPHSFHTYATLRSSSAEPHSGRASLRGQLTC